MDLHSLYPLSSSDGHIFWSEEEGFILASTSFSKEKRRHVLALVFKGLVNILSERGVAGDLTAQMRALWQLHAPYTSSFLPKVIEHDAFLRMYAEGAPLTLKLFRTLYEATLKWERRDGIKGNCKIGETLDASLYHDIKSVPAGLPPKFSSKIRKKNDPKLLEYVQSDLIRASKIEDHEKRVRVTLALLSHGAAYRDIEGKILYIPSFHESGRVVPYAFVEHLIWEGVKTMSASPLEHEHTEKALYICQGTEIWPSQPMMLGSIFANLNKEGPATEPYAYAWRQIHKHLIALARKTNQLPIVSGHSMGGALATQIALYSHLFIERAYAFNPPVVSQRDYRVYHSLAKETQEKLHVFASIDDLPFWRLGSYVIGKVFVLLGEKRWKYYPLSTFDRFFVFSGIWKMYMNIIHMVPSHQDIVFLMQSYVVVTLTQEEIEQENDERTKRSGHIRFISKLYRLVRFILGFSRKYLRWEKRLDYLRSQLEIVELHESDLKETKLLVGHEIDVDHELTQLKKEKMLIQKEIEILLARGK